MLPEDKYKEEMGLILEQSGASFLMVKFEHSRAFRGDGSVTNMLAYLLNCLRLKHSTKSGQERLRKSNLFFRCLAGKAQKMLGMTEHRQRRCLRTLESYGIVETKRRGGNALWVRVVGKALQDMVKDGRPKARNAESEELDKRGTETRKARNSEKRGKRGSLLDKNEKKEKNPRSRESEPVNGLLPEETDHRSPEYRRAEQWSCRFYKAVRRYLTENNTGVKLPNTSKGPAEFLKLGQQQEADTIEAVLSWYEQHIGEKYIHEAFCARTFRLKFVEIAQDRRKQAERQSKATADTIRFWRTVYEEAPAPGKPGHTTKVARKAEFDWPVARIPQRLRGIVLAAVKAADGQPIQDTWDIRNLVDNSW